jgi:hypothetical protein
VAVRWTDSGANIANYTVIFSVNNEPDIMQTVPASAPLTATANTAYSGGGGDIEVKANPATSANLSATAEAVFKLGLPATADLSAFNPPANNQGNINSCSSWAIDYYLRGWYANRDGYYPGGAPDGYGGFAPMFTYAPYTAGQGLNHGETAAGNLDILVREGVDTRADYTQGDYDQTDLPTAAEEANAAKYKIAGYFDDRTSGTAAQNELVADIAAGRPAVISVLDTPELRNPSATNNWLVGPPSPGESNNGPHFVFAYKYDYNGVWIENSWGSALWGLNGTAELSWSFIDQTMSEVVTMDPESAPGAQAQVGNQNTLANADGRVEAFDMGADGNLQHRYQLNPGGSAWSGWLDLGPRVESTPVVARNLDGRLEVFALGPDGNLGHMYQTAPNGTWSSWGDLAPVTRPPAVAQNADGRLEVFALGPDGNLGHMYQTAPNGTWSSWGDLGPGLSNGPVVARNADGRLEVFGTTPSGNVLGHMAQTAPNSGWGSWVNLAANVSGRIEVGLDAAGYLQVFATGADGSYSETGQISGGWSPWGYWT